MLAWALAPPGVAWSCGLDDCVQRPWCFRARRARRVTHLLGWPTRPKLAHMFSGVHADVEAINAALDELWGDLNRAPAALRELWSALPALQDEIRAMALLAHVGEPLLRPIFSRTDAVGSVMRRKLEPVSKPLLEQIARLRGLQ